MKILIIGGTGLISTPMTRQFLERGDEVVLYNRGQTPARIADEARHIRGDRGNYAAFEKQMADDGPFDCVIDMVCYTPDEAESAVRAFKRRTGHLIFCSSCAVYRMPCKRYPIREDEDRVCGNDYGGNKAKCEDVLLAAHARGDFQVTVIRPGLTYGEGGTLYLYGTFGWGTTFIDRIRKAKPIIVPGDGTALFPICYVDDVSRAFVGAAGNTRAFGKVYNVTGEEWMTANHYYELLAQAAQSPPPTVVHIPSCLLGRLGRKEGTGTFIYDNSAAVADLGFRYTVPWVEGARRTIAWLDEQGTIENSDLDPFEDRVIAAWRRLGDTMVEELANERLTNGA